MPNARPPRHRTSKSNRLRTFLIGLLLLTKSQIWRRIVKLLRKTYERMITWFSARFLTPPSESRTKNTIDKPFPINLDSSETCCFPHPFSLAGDSFPLAIFPAQLPTMPLPQVEELSSSGGDTGSFVTIDDVGSVDAVDLHRSSIPVVDPYGIPPRPISPSSPAIPWPNERAVTPYSDSLISPVPSASNRGPSASDHTPAVHMRHPSPTQDDDLPMSIPMPRRLLETPLLAIASGIDCPRLVPIVPPDLPRYSRSINM